MNTEVQDAVEPAQELFDTPAPAVTTAIAEYNQTAVGLAALRARYASVVWDCSTTKGDKDARAVRKELVTLRTSLEAMRKAIKAPALERARLIDAEAKTITEQIKALEDPVDEAIAAEEARKETLRLQRLADEEARIRALQERISDIANVAIRAVGLSSAEIARKTELVTRMVIPADENAPDGFQELTAHAINTKAEALLRLADLNAAALEREAAAELARKNAEELAALREAQAAREKQDADERAAKEAAAAEERRGQEAADAAARLAANVRAGQLATSNALVAEIRQIMRRALVASSAGILELTTLVENIVIGAELGEAAGFAQVAKDDALADLHAMHGTLVAREAHDRDLRAESARMAEAKAKLEREQAELLAAQEAAKPKASPELVAAFNALLPEPPAGEPVAAAEPIEPEPAPVPLPEPVAAPVADPALTEPACVSTGDICRRLGFVLTVDFLSNTLGTPPAQVQKRAALWTERQFAAICAALVRHIEGVAA